MATDALLTNLIRKTNMKFEQRAKEDLSAALQSFTDLVPEAKMHEFPDGQKRMSLAITGTIPVKYKGNTYHIPIALHCLDTHPYTGPYCYVCPTPTMRVKQSNTVDQKGRIYLPYLTEWNFPNHDTCGLLQVMTFTFEEKCPVFSVSASNKSTSSNSRNSPYSTTPSNTTPTPYPPADQNPPYPTANPSGLPYPNHPMSVPMPNAYATPSPNVNSAPYPTYQPPYQPFSNLPAPASSGSMPSYTGTIQQSHIRASLISAIEDRIRQRLRDNLGTSYAEFQSVDINLQELRTGQQKLREMLDNMQREQKQIDLVANAYKEKKAELEQILSSYNVDSKSDSVDGESEVDKAIDATTPVHRQIVRCYVVDCAIDDTIYYLGQALKKGGINLQTYLKYVRDLSREQFVQRALMQKCRQKAKLPI